TAAARSGRRCCASRTLPARQRPSATTSGRRRHRTGSSRRISSAFSFEILAVVDERVGYDENTAAGTHRERALRGKVYDRRQTMIERGKLRGCRDAIPSRKALQRRVELLRQTELRHDATQVDDLGSH